MIYIGNDVHQTAIIHPSVQMGLRNKIGPYTVIGPNVTLGNDNQISGHVSIGSQPEHKAYWDCPVQGPVRIGSNNVIREFVTINSPTKGITKMGNSCVMLRGSHLSHDSILEDFVNVSCNVLIGGETYVQRGANLGLGAIIHQQQVIGAYAMLGMGTVVPKKVDIKPGRVYVGNPADFLKINDIGIQRSGVSQEELGLLIEQWKLKRGKS